MKDLIYWSPLASAFGAAPQAVAQVTFYESERVDGRSLALRQQPRNLGRAGFDAGMSSAVVRDDRWEACHSARLILASEHIDPSRFAPPPVAIYDGRRRSYERLFRVPVTSVRAVMGETDRLCWMEREAVALPPGQGTSVPGAVAGSRVEGGSQPGQVQTRDVDRCRTTAASCPAHHWELTYNFRGQDHMIQTAVPPGLMVTVNRRCELRT